MYMSPECLSGQSYGINNDLYSLGIVLYEMIYGQVPYNCNSAEELLALIYNKGPALESTLNFTVP